MVRKLNVKPRLLEPPLIVSIPNRGKILVNKYKGSILMNVQGKSNFAMNYLVGIEVILVGILAKKNKTSGIKAIFTSITFKSFSVLVERETWKTLKYLKSENPNNPKEGLIVKEP